VSKEEKKVDFQQQNANIPIDKQDKTLSGADGFRAIACLMVMFHHVFSQLYTFDKSLWVAEIQKYFLTWQCGVCFFFVLSGYLLAYPFWKHYFNSRGFPDLKNYILRRAARIVPGYYVALIFTFILSQLFFKNINFFWPRLLTSLTFTYSFHYITFFPNDFNTPLWSIGCEVFFYVMLPLFMVGLFYSGQKRSLRKALLYWLIVEILLIGLNGLIHQYFTPDNINRGFEFGIIGGAKSWLPNYNPVGLFTQFTFGILASGIMVWFSRSDTLKMKINKIYGFDIAAVVILLTIIIFLWFMRNIKEFGFSLQSQPYYFPFLAVLAAGLLVLLAHSQRVGKIIDNRFFRFTAKISFGLYIWHYIIVNLIMIYLNGEYYYKSITNYQTWFFFSIIMFATAYLIASASYYFIEKPFLEKAHRKIAVIKVAKTA
jgi:peptidoglycan/LPS O-acetylase OafA/YrhL